MPRKAGHPLNIYLDDDDNLALNELHERTKEPKSYLLRKALRSYHKMVISGIPTCASGMPCFWPQHHPHSVPVRDIPGQVQMEMPAPKIRTASDPGAQHTPAA